MDINRRRVLRAIAATGAVGLAGCGGSNEGGPGTTNPPDESQQTESDGSPEQPGTASPQTGTTPPPSSWTPGATPAQPGTLFSVPFKFDVEVVNSQPTPDGPPIVRITITNKDEENHSLTIRDWNFPFASARDTRDGARLVLATEIADWEDRDGRCWTARSAMLPDVNGKRFDPGESVSVRRAVMNQEGSRGSPADACWPRDTFLFTELYFLDSSTPKSDDGRGFQWGFWVRVTDVPAIQVGEIQPFQI